MAAVIAGASACAFICACGLSIVGATNTDDSANPDAGSATPSNDAFAINDDGAANADGTSPSDGATGQDAAGADTAGPPVITFVQSATSKDSTSSSITATFAAPTHAGSFLAVMISHSNTLDDITGVVDNASGGTNTYLSTGARSSASTCQASEIWYARDARANATSITVNIDGSQLATQLWIVEVAGLAKTGIADAIATGDGDSATITTPLVTPLGAPSLIVAAIGSCGTIGNIVGANPFIALPIQDGNRAAYYIPSVTGSFGAVFTNTNNNWNASLAAFR